MEGYVNESFKGDDNQIEQSSVPCQTNNESESKEAKCGYLCWEPDFLQKFNNATCSCLWLCIASFFQGAIVSGLTNGSITTLERRFGLSSKEMSVVVIMYQVGCILAIVILSQIGSRIHQMRLLSTCVLLLGIGSFIFSIPHYISSTYNFSSEQNFECSANYNDGCQDSKDVSKGSVLFLLGLGQFLLGVGSGPLYSTTFVYFDQNMSRRKSSLTTGLFYGIGIIGPAVGYVTQGAVLKLYGDFNRVDLDKIDLKSDDPRFYGAWWLTFIFGSIFCVLNCIPLYCFASYLPNTEEYKVKNTQKKLRGLKLKELMKTIWSEFKTILSIKSYVFVILADMCNAFLVNGLASFAVKFAEIVAYLEPSTAAILTGGIIVVGCGVGSIGGTIILERLNWGCRKIMIFTSIVMCLSVIPSFGMLFGCDTHNYIGITERSSQKNIIDSCNSNCNCSLTSYEPICDSQKNYYISPCHAACEKSLKNDEFTQCGCVPGGVTEVLKPFSECQPTCKYVYALGVVLFVYATLGFCSATPHIQMMLRTVPFNLRHLATSLGWFVGRLLGMIPGPFAFAAILDNSCLYWRKTCNGDRSCAVFDHKEVRTNFAIVTVVINILSAVSMLIALYTYNPEEGSDEIDKATTISDSQKARNGTELNDTSS
ncbi:DgyrCDS9597 [Dimorphilus gyrociliatus]|uniref:Solute carrier organic anion transporter family member n=1 Tax=Dimorphilus gyrociliatus TaxID=2664684 RepID=A0A7I8VZ35_9ANNE|nr:DgyrCDS9597 [Dimorphilus gyrociliatus]